MAENEIGAGGRRPGTGNGGGAGGRRPMAENEIGAGGRRPMAENEIGANGRRPGTGNEIGAGGRVPAAEGVLNIYKERGFTSHDVVARLRGILGMRRIGHTGTLDPDAEGVLPVCLGRATRLCGMLTDERKTYRAVMLLGVETDTQDGSGRVLRSRPVQVTEEEVTEAAGSFEGGYDQVPPMYSAVKVDGKRLYRLARQGRTVEREPRRVAIYRITVDWVELPRVAMTVECSRGTYIRTLCHDIGGKLGCGACMEALTRTRVGRFLAEDALTLAQVKELRDAGALASRIVPADALFDGCPAARTLPEADRPARNGNPLRLSQVRLEEGAPAGGTRVRLYDSRGLFIGIYRYGGEQAGLKPEKMFLAAEAPV